MTTTTVYAPDEAPFTAPGIHIFLAGTIDMGESVDWQADVIKKLEERDMDVVIFNPRRPAWDSSWEQDISNENFREQVEWELNHIDSVDYVIVNFLPGSQSPVTLMELGYLLGWESAKLFVCCPEGFWRRGNVQIMCKREDIEVYNDMDSLMKDLIGYLEEYH